MFAKFRWPKLDCLLPPMDKIYSSYSLGLPLNQQAFEVLKDQNRNRELHTPFIFSIGIVSRIPNGEFIGRLKGPVLNQGILTTGFMIYVMTSVPSWFRRVWTYTL